MLKGGNLKRAPISIAKWSMESTEVGEAHITNDAKDNITFAREGALL